MAVLLLRRGRPTMVVVLCACIVCVGECVGFLVRERCVKQGEGRKEEEDA